MNELEKARIKINEIDEQIRKLFEKRMQAVEEVIQYKMKHELDIFDEKREKEVLKRNVSKLGNEQLKPYYEEFLIQSMRISKEYQNAILHQGMSGYQGIEGAFGQIAASRLFGNKKLVNYSSFEEVIKAVENHEIERGILPFENSTTGEVGEVLDLLYEHDVKISAVYDLKVDQNLMAPKGASLSTVKKVYSKMQALEQCADTLKAFDFELIPYGNTALAARYVSECQNIEMAAIASKECAGEYGLEILLSNINTSSDNITRFIVVENELPKSGNLVMVLFTLNHHSGALAHMMQIIADYQLNMTNIRSRACKSAPWQYYFYVELEGKVSEMEACFEECRKECRDFRIIGCVKEEKI